MSGSFIEREIDVTITLGATTFGSTGKNQVKLTGHRVSATIAKAGAPYNDTADIRIFGLTLEVMQGASTLGVPFDTYRTDNSVAVEAGDAVNGMSLVYFGALANAWIALDAAPESYLQIIGMGPLAGALSPVPPVSIGTTFNVADVMSGIAESMNFAFENSGVDIVMPSCYLSGTATDQAKKLAKAADINMVFDSSKNLPVLAIWPKTGTRKGAIPNINAQSGMISYPAYSDHGMTVRTLFNPSILLGGVINMQSQIGGAPTTQAASYQQIITAGPNGTWNVNGPLVHDLSARMPGGPWFTTFTCSRTVTSGA